MSSFFHKKQKPANVPQYATRDEIIALYAKYWNTMPPEEAITAHMGNPGGIKAIEQLLTVAPPPIILRNPPFGQITSPILVASNVRPLGMSYWRNLNQHKNDDNVKMFVSKADEITIYTIQKSDLSVIDVKALGINHTGEGCFFSALRPNILYVPIDNEMREYNIADGTYEVHLSIRPNEKIWQAHLSYDENRMSCTVKDIDWAWKEWYAAGKRYPFGLEPDECQIDKSGNWLMIKEENLNRIIYIPTGAERVISNALGALGHGDIGFSCALGENDVSPLPGALDWINFQTGEHLNIYSTGIWNMGYFSFTNAKPNTFIADSFGLLSTPRQLIKVKLNPNGQGLPFFNYPETNVYEDRVKANLCPEGEYAAFSMRDGGLNAYIVRVP